MKRQSDEWIRERIKEHGADWVAEQRFWLFGTGTYYDGRKISKRQAMRDIRHFFNTVDRKLLKRQDYNEGNRLPRLVFLEAGKQRDNTHFHFFIKGTHLKQYRHIISIAEHNWNRHIAKARDLVMQDNMGLIMDRKAYCWKEFDDLDSETLLVECCHLSPPQYT